MPRSCSEVRAVAHTHVSAARIGICPRAPAPQPIIHLLLFHNTSVFISQYVCFYLTSPAGDHRCCRTNGGSDVVGHELCPYITGTAAILWQGWEVLVQGRAEQITAANRWKMTMGPQRICWKSLSSRQWRQLLLEDRLHCCLGYLTASYTLKSYVCVLFVWTKTFFLADGLLISAVIIILMVIWFCWKAFLIQWDCSGCAAWHWVYFSYSK